MSIILTTIVHHSDSFSTNFWSWILGPQTIFIRVIAFIFYESDGLWTSNFWYFPPNKLHDSTTLYLLLHIYILGSRWNPSLLFKVFFQGAVRLRVFTMCTSIGGTPPHLSSYFSGKGLAFVHFLYLWFTLVYLSCLYLVIWKLYFSVVFLSFHCSSGYLMKSSICQFLHFNNKASWCSNFTL